MRLEKISKRPYRSHLQYLQNYPSRVLRVLRVTAVGAFYFSRSGERMKRIPKRIRHKPWCAIHLPSIGRRDCWYEDDDGDRRPDGPRRPRPLAGGSTKKELEDA
jgi:hypothetical protein